MPKAEVKTEYPGIVPVRVIDNREGLLREGSPVGFLGVKRHKDEVFKINKPEEFSPRWMEFVEPDNLPEGWAEIIAQREAARSERLQEKAEREKKSDAMVQAELIQLAVRQTIETLAGAQALNQGRTPAIQSHEINFSGGKMEKRKPKLSLED